MDANLLRRVGVRRRRHSGRRCGSSGTAGWPLVVLVALVGVLGTRELFDLARRQRIEPAAELGLLTVLVFAPLAYLALTAMYEHAGGCWPVGLYGGAVWLMLA